MGNKKKAPEASEKPAPTFNQPTKARCRPVIGSVFAVLGILILVSLFDFHPDQDVVNTTDPTGENLVGRFGAKTAFFTFHLLGGAAWLVPTLMIWVAWILFSRSYRLQYDKVIALAVLLLTGAGLLAMQTQLFVTEGVHTQGPGGVVGTLLYDQLLRYNIGVFGSVLIMGAAFLFALLLLVTRDLAKAADGFFHNFGERRTKRKEQRKKRREERRTAREEAAREKAQRKLNAEFTGVESVKQSPPPPATRKKPSLRDINTARNSPSNTKPADAPETPAAIDNRIAAPIKIVTGATTRKAASPPLPKNKGDYQFPDLDLLDQPEESNETESEDDHVETADNLVRTLKEFGVEVTMGEVHTGPVITRYEVFPAAGVRVERIVSLDKNIALALKATAVRIMAPVPGKGCVGIEVPNRHAKPVRIREIIESEDWAGSHAEIPIALGKDVSGKPLIADLTKMPHLLIAGATGAGKTVCINSIITSLLYHASPDDLRFLMVDPKIVEMKIFNDLPHMLIPVVTEPKKVPGALKWLINEMERRYQIFAKVGVRNIAGFNAHRKKEAEKAEQQPAAASPAEDDPMGAVPEAVAPEVHVPRDSELEIPEKLPYIVAIIDELADLMMVAPADVESGIARLAQLARAAGIHLVIATQRPSVNVITGVIKANLPSRIAFQVASKVDSRTILDTGGAEQLIGRGDMLFSPPGSSRLVRSQGAFISDDEINRIVDFLKQNGPPQFSADIQEQIERPDAEDSADEEEDDLLSDAIEVLRSTKRASTSMLQRRLRVGYNRAARLMEIMERRGIVGPENGSSPREILVNLEED